MILRMIATLKMSESDKRKYGIEGRGALDGYADADWWRALAIDLQFIEDELLVKAFSDIKRVLIGIMKALDVLQSEIKSFKSQ